AGRVADQRMVGYVRVELGDPQEAALWFGRAAASGDAESAYNLGLLLIAERGDIAGGRHWLRQAALSGHRQAGLELGTLLSLTGRGDDVEQWCDEQRTPASDQPTFDHPVDPELTARAELAVAACGRRGGPELAVADLIEVLGTWDLVTRVLRDPFDAVTWLTRHSGLRMSAVQHLRSVCVTLTRPGTAPWPTGTEIEQVLGTARALRRRLDL
ncbi:MAG TPA: sel1 repeat family protein, partial [Thermopolyspora sp.]